MKHQNCR